MAITSTLTESEWRAIRFGRSPAILLGKLTTLDTEINLKATTAANDLKAPLASPTFTGTITAAIANFSGLVTMDAGIVAGKNVLTIADSTNTLSAATLTSTYRNSYMWVLDATLVVTLPEPTGSGDFYHWTQGISATTSSFVTTDTTNTTFAGNVTASAVDDEGTTQWPAMASDDVYSYNGTTLGGIIHSWVQFIDIATDVWLVSGNNIQTGGSEATPFTAS